MATSSQTAAQPTGKSVVGQLSLLDRFLPLWILLAMAVGVGLGAVAPGIKDVFNALRIDTVSLPIAIGLLWMMYPVLAKVRYEELGKIGDAKRQFSVSLVLNWLIGPFSTIGPSPSGCWSAALPSSAWWCWEGSPG